MIATGARLGLMVAMAADAPAPAPCLDSTAPAAGLSLYCTALVPTPDLPDVAGALELRPVPSPFGVSVTRGGRTRYRLAAVTTGLPAPSALGPFTTYVAWAATLSFDSLSKLGEIRNGRTELGEVAYNYFRVIVTAEPSKGVTRRSRRIVLRATSPSALLLAHREPARPTGTATRGRHVQHGRDSSTWTMPPMPPGMRMPAGMGANEPSVARFRPGPGSDMPALSEARPSEVVQLRSGDTLALEAGLVRRAIAGTPVAMYAFNGQYPGPRIEVNQGATIVVRFRNRVQLPAAVHWHGVRLENRFDGTAQVTQPPVQPGDSFLYQVHFPDPGVYWYHAHHREDALLDLGLYGSIVVRSPDAAYYAPVNREESLVLDDLLIDDAGVFPYGMESPTHALMGRFGNVFLLNGEPSYALDVRRGEVVRFLLTNASSARIYNVSFGDAPIKLVAADGGKLGREAWVESVVIAPSERYVVEVRFDKPGSLPLTNRVQALDHMVGSFFPEVDTLGLVRVSAERAAPDHGATFARLRSNAGVSSELARYRRFIDRPADRTLSLELRARGLPPAVSRMLAGVPVPVDWNDAMPMLNWVTTGKELTWVLRDPATAAENMDIGWRFTQGDVIKLRIVNQPNALHAMSHPIHIHGQRFLVLKRNGDSNEHLAWKDTAVIPVGETVDLLVDMANPGLWMLHCHIAEHLSVGMMAVFEVQPREN